MKVNSGILSFVGASLILLSTFVSGYLVFSYENEIDSHNEHISRLKAQQEKAQSAFSEAVIRGMLLDINNQIFKLSVYSQIEELQKVYAKPYAAGLYNQILSLYVANGIPVVEENVVGVKELRDRVLSGDEKAIETLNQQVSELFRSSGHYTGDFYIKIADLVVFKSDISKKINLCKYLSITLQIIGLIMLLLKEIQIKPHTRH